MREIRVLVANEPLSYREAIAYSFRALRPRVEVIEAEPIALEREVRNKKPDLVICSRLTPTIEKLAPAWVVLYPEGDPVAMISTAGELSTITDIDLDNLLAVVDQVSELSDSNSGSRAI